MVSQNYLPNQNCFDQINNMKKFISYSFLFLLLIGCNKDIDNKLSHEIVLESIPEPYESPDALFDFVNITTLKNPNDVILSVSRIIENDQGIFILDRTAKRIMLFDDNGLFVRDFGNIGGGPGEYETIYDFFIIDELLYLFSPSNLSLFSYEIKTGKFVSKSPLQAFAQRIVPISKTEILLYVANNPTDTNFNVYRYDLNGNKLGEYFPFDPQKSTSIVMYTGFLIDGVDGVYYCDPYGYQIFKYNPESKEFDIVYELGFVSEEIRNDRENIDKYTSSYALESSNRIRYPGSVFLRNENFMMLSMTYDTRVQTVLLDLQQPEAVKTLSAKVKNDFIRFLKRPFLLGDDNILLYAFGPEFFQSFEFTQNLPIMNSIYDSIEEFSEDDLLYLVRLKIK